MKALALRSRGLWHRAGLAALLFYLVKGLCWIALGYAAWRR
jgi:hypothetical protein